MIKFFEAFGPQATKRAYGYSRSTIYLWKKSYREAKFNPQALLPKSRRPHHFRPMEVDFRVIIFLKDLRQRYPRLGKQKLKPLLDAFCQREGLRTIAEATIGKVIKRNHLFSAHPGRIYHNPASGYARQAKRLRKRISSRLKAKAPGELLQVDTIVRFETGVRRYFLTAIDLASRFSFAFSYKTLSSRMALDFYQKLEQVAPFPVQAIKTDNGLEFLGDFDQYLERRGITHYFSYPRTPQANAYVERFNRTLQEEFVDNHLESLEDTEATNDKLIDYLIFFNTVRPHQALDLLTPMGFLVAKHLVSKMCVASTLT